MKILLVEDDEWIAEPLAEALTDQRYVVEIALDGRLAWELIQVFSYDLVILDVMLPHLDGIELCRRIRCAGLATPILMLTAKDTSRDKIAGLDAGADDYLIKPFDLAELMARVRALRRRGATVMPLMLERGGLQLNPVTCAAQYDRCDLHLTPKEYGLLEFFLRHPGRVLRPDEILNQLWASTDPPGKETIKTHLRSVRQKLSDRGAPGDFIETVYGFGYRLK
jgi:two-component system, OmpR family, response regulator